MWKPISAMKNDVNKNTEHTDCLSVIPSHNFERVTQYVRINIPAATRTD